MRHPPRIAFLRDAHGTWPGDVGSPAHSPTLLYPTLPFSLPYSTLHCRTLHSTLLKPYTTVLPTLLKPYTAVLPTCSAAVARVLWGRWARGRVIAAARTVILFWCGAPGERKT